MNSNPSVPFEWLFETLNKRIGAPYNIPLKELYLVVPYVDEAEFEYELTKPFNSFGAAQGIILADDYPNLHKILSGGNRKEITIRVFFLRHCRRACILWTRRHPYPKVSKAKGLPQILAESVVRRVEQKRALGLIS